MHCFLLDDKNAFIKVTRHQNCLTILFGSAKFWKDSNSSSSRIVTVYLEPQKDSKFYDAPAFLETGCTKSFCNEKAGRNPEINSNREGMRK